MDVVIKVNSRSSARVKGKPEIPQRVQVVIQAGPGQDGKKASVTRHLRYEDGCYVGREWDQRARRYVQTVWSLGILADGGLKEDVRLAA